MRAIREFFSFFGQDFTGRVSLPERQEAMGSLRRMPWAGFSALCNRLSVALKGRKHTGWRAMCRGGGAEQDCLLRTLWHSGKVWS